MKRVLAAIVLLAVAVLSSHAIAAAKPHALFSDNAVLQQGISVPVWGTAGSGEIVTVTFQNQKVSTEAKDGKWMVRLKPMKAGGPFTMTINTIELKNVMVGEVWIASGQSNMQLPLSKTTDADAVIAASADPMLRLFTVPRTPAVAPATDVTGNWSESTPDTVKEFTAVGYFFGRDLRKALNVPVGLIHTSWGGTRVEAWTALPVLQSDPDFAESMKDIKHYGKAPNHPAVLYNGMIAPLIPYAIRGAIWYQGEANANAGQSYRYQKRFTNMITNWRTDWKQGDFPFLFVQLAPFGKIVEEPGDSSWAELRESQLLTSINCPKTGMAVTMDVGNPADIHPQNKGPVGERLALAARALTYGERVAYKGPRYASMAVHGNRAILTFTEAVEAKGGDLTGFAVAGDDRKFRNAQATILGDRVIISSDQVANPVAVRYGWADAPIANLFGKEGLPASPFRTDNWPMATAPKPAAK
jgi:sialate O-acetylesterase